MATKGIGRPLTIMLRADTDGFSKGIQTAETKLKSLNKSLNKASVMAGVALGGLAAAGFEFAQAAAQDEKSARVLEKTLQNVTGATKAQTAAVEDYISATSLALGIQDDELRPALARLVRSTEDAAEAQKLLNLALDISAATGKPVEAIANALGKAYDGNATALGRLGLGVDSAILKSKDFGVVYDDLAGKFEGFAKSEAATGEGALRRLSVAVDEAKESIGKGLLPFVVQAADALTKLAPKIEKNADVILKLAAGIAATATSIIALNAAIKVVTALTQIYTGVMVVARTTTLFLAAATGSASAAQILAEATYKKSTTALVLYNVALAISTTATKLATIGVKGLTKALLLNPFTFVITGALLAADALYKWQQSTLETARSTEQVGGYYDKQAGRLLLIAGAANLAAKGVDGLAKTTSNAAQESRDAARSQGRNSSKYVSSYSSISDEIAKLETVTKSYSKSNDKASKAAEKAAKKAKEQAKAAEIAAKAAEKLRKQQEALAAIKKSFDDYAAGVKNALSAQFSFQSAFEAKGKGSFLEALKKQAAAALAFSGKIAKLVALGLSRGSIDQVLAAGPQIGGQIADELLAGGATAIKDVNTLVASVNKVTGQTGKAVSSALGGFNGQGNINITINGAIDPEGVRRSLEKLFQQSGARIGAVNLASSSL